MYSQNPRTDELVRRRIRELLHEEMRDINSNPFSLLPTVGKKKTLETLAKAKRVVKHKADKQQVIQEHGAGLSGGVFGGELVGGELVGGELVGGELAGGVFGGDLLLTKPIEVKTPRKPRKQRAPTKRNFMVKELVKEGMTLAQASKYIKNHGLY